MSKTVDERIVSMQFDNKHFEKNVSVTMSTLDKLKAKLDFTGAAKGLENISTAANKVDMNGLGRGVEEVQAKFSALDVMAVTVLSNITNSTFNAGKKIASALTIDPIKSGFQEYETQMNSVQTILANTSSKGSTLEDVNTALEELNKYADQTIYNFTEMTRNIGTFTAAGVDLDTSVSAIKGIANLAAVSGSTSQQASTAMYQLSQALAAGTVKLQDWNSVVNAGMGGEVFQNALKRTATNMGYDVEGMITKYGSFRESLSRGEWLTTDVLTETLNQFTLAAEEGTEQWEEYKASLKEKGYTDAQAEEILKMANTATDAATKVKTFTQLWDVLKEAAGSGWAQTWKIIVGDFEEAKALFSPLAEFLTGIINKMSDARNEFLEGALGATFTGLLDNINNVTSGVENTVTTLKEYGEIVDKVLGGSYGNGKARWDKLTEEGYDWAHVQNLVNEKLGDGTRHATEYAEAQGEVAEAQYETNLADGKSLEMLAALSDAELENIGYNEMQIASLRELQKEAEKTGIPLAQFIDNIDQINGRWLLIESFKNVGQSIVKIFKALGEAWRDAFPPMSGEVLYNIIAAMHKFSLHLKMGDETADKLTRTFKGLFAIIDIVATLFGGAFRTGLKIVTTILETLFKALGFVDFHILDITANIGDAIVAFRDWFESINPITKAIEFIVPLLVKMGKAVVDLFKTVYHSEEVQTAITAVKDAFAALGEIIDKYFGGAIGTIKSVVKHIKSLDQVNLSDLASGFKTIGESLSSAFSNLPSDIFDGFIKGLGDGAKRAYDTIVIFCTNFIEKAKDVLGIHSPSVIFASIGAFVILGLINGLQDTASTLWISIQSIVQNMFDIAGDIITKGIPFLVDGIKTLGAKLLEALKASDLDLRDLIVAGSIVSAILIFNKFINVLKTLTGPLEALEEVFDGLGNALDGLGKKFKAQAWEARANAVKTMAIAVAILGATLLVLGKQDNDVLIKGAAALVAVAAALLLVTFATKMIKGDTKGFVKLSTLMVGLSISIAIVASALKKMAGIDSTQMETAIYGLVSVIGAMGTLMVIFGLLTKNDKIASSIDKAGGMIFKISVALAIMATAMKIMGTLSTDALDRGIQVLILFTVFMGIMVTLSSFSGQYADKAGSMLLKMSVAIGIMALAIKAMGMITIGDIITSLAVLTMVGILFGTMIFISFYAGEHASKAGTMLMKMSVAIGILALSIKLLSGLDSAGVDKSMDVIYRIGEMFIAFIMITWLFSDESIDKAGNLLMKMSIAIGILALTLGLLTLLGNQNLGQAFAIITTMMVLFTLIIGVSLFAGEHADKAGEMIMKMSIAILLLTGCMALLSLLNPEDVWRGMACVSGLLILFGALIFVTKFAKPLSKTLTMMAVCFGILIGGVALLTFLDQDKLINATTCVSVLLGMFALLVASTHFAKSAQATLLVLTAAIAVLGIVLYKIAELPVESTRNAAESLSILMLALAVSFAIIGATSAMSASAIPALAIMIVAMGMLVLMMNQMVKMDVQPSIETAAALSIMLIAMAAACVILAAVGSVAVAALAGAIALVGVIAIIGGFMIAVGKLIKDTAPLEKGIETLNKVAHGIGEFLGNIVGGFLEGVTSGLPQMGKDLSDFMINALPFIVGAKAIDGTMMNGVKALAETVLILTATDIIQGLTSWFTGGSSLADFGMEIAMLGPSLAIFAASVAGIDSEAIKNAAEGVKALALAATEIPNEGGWAAKIFGDNSIASFATQLPIVGLALSGFVTSLGTFGKDQVETVQNAADAIKAMALSADEIPNQGGWAAKIFGDNSIATFATQLPIVGLALSSFATNLGTFKEDKVATIKCAADAIKAMAEAGKNIDGQSEWAAKLFGDNSLATFSEDLKDVGTNLASFAENLGTFKEDKVATVNSAVNVIKSIAELGTLDIETISDNLPTFGTSIVDFAGDLASFCTKMADVSSEGIGATLSSLVQSISDTATKISEKKTGFSKAATELVDALKNGITEKKSALDTACEQLIESAKTAIINQRTKFSEAAKSLLTALTTVVDEFKDLDTSVISLVENAADAISDCKSDFETAGKNLGDGLVLGLSNKDLLQKVKDAGFKLGQKAVEGEKEGQESNSPSKATERAGKWLGEGLIIGIDNMSKKVYNAGHDLGERAANSMTSVMSKVSDIINSDIDSQPTIRPVLDLSAVSDGASQIGGMLGLNPTLGLASSAGAINASMDARIQNGNNKDVIAAINKLGKNLNGNTNTTYINGITYDDGSNINDAVKTLVRAAKVERRK